MFKMGKSRFKFSLLVGLFFLSGQMGLLVGCGDEEDPGPTVGDLDAGTDAADDVAPLEPDADQGPEPDAASPDVEPEGRFADLVACDFPVTMTIPLEDSGLPGSIPSGSAFLCFDLQTGDCGLTVAAATTDLIEPCGPDPGFDRILGQELTPVEVVGGFQAIGEAQSLSQTLIVSESFWSLVSVSEGELFSSSKASDLPPDTRIVAVVEPCAQADDETGECAQLSGRQFTVEFIFEPEDPDDVSLTTRRVTFFRFEEN